MRILHLSDLHIEPTPEERMPGLMRSLDNDRRQIVRSGADLVLVSGDLTTYGSSEVSHLALAREWLDSLGLPYLAVPGNHDLGPSPWRAEKSPRAEAYEDVAYKDTGYGRTFDPNPLVSYDLDVARVIGVGLREGDPDGVLRRLDTVLGSDSRPVILFGHYPVVPVREPKIHPDFGSEEFIPRTGQALAALVRRHRNVAVYACGHVHVSSARRLAPHCLQITAGSLGQGSSSYRVFDLNDDGLSFATMLGSGPLTFWDGAVPGLDMEFSLGDPAERSGWIPWA
ncbi:metallophosphoesterase family protein [Actinopolymorpha alba]|uniref:metallophosphoesterase family protein n=1 Tax=Actinopolymorpha alba TaxID=533267 RepID=UPI00037EADF8|nr:metallophosphoesterase [Actinopolymorpha alba]